MTPSTGPQPPEVTAAKTVDALVVASKRTIEFRLRREFLQQTQNGKLVAGPLAGIVRAGDLRALQLYLLLVTKATAEPWNSAMPATVWARALDIALPDSKTARSTVSKIWLRLEGHGLVRRERSKRLADVYLLREDGSGGEYTSPGGANELYFKVPLALWQEGPDADHRWYQVLRLPELVVLLIARSLGDAFRLPYEAGPDWYGISADTIQRGVDGLSKKGLLQVDKTYKEAPLSAVGYTAEHRYTLLGPFGPIGRRSGERAKKLAPASKSSGTKKPAAKTAKKSKTAKRSKSISSATAKKIAAKKAAQKTQFRTIR